jgi:hypothetical protein
MEYGSSGAIGYCSYAAASASCSSVLMERTSLSAFLEVLSACCCTAFVRGAAMYRVCPLSRSDVAAGAWAAAAFAA